jgi:hypothetical protein
MKITCFLVAILLGSGSASHAQQFEDSIALHFPGLTKAEADTLIYETYKLGFFFSGRTMCRVYNTKDVGDTRPYYRQDSTLGEWLREINNSSLTFDRKMMVTADTLQKIFNMRGAYPFR